MAFFHNREVGAEVRIEYAVKSQALQGRYHLARYDTARFHAQLFAERYADSRRDLADDDLVGIVDGVPYAFRIVLFANRRRRAHAGALSAVGAGYVGQILLEGRRDHGVKAAAGVTVYVHLLYVAAHADAAAAENTFILIADETGIGIVYRMGFHFPAVEAPRADAQVGGHLLKLAVAVLLAGQTVLRMICQQELHDHTAGRPHLARIRLDDHAFGYGITAAGDQSFGAADFADAETARAFRL